MFLVRVVEGLVGGQRRDFRKIFRNEYELPLGRTEIEPVAAAASVGTQLKLISATVRSFESGCSWTDRVRALQRDLVDDWRIGPITRLRYNRGRDGRNGCCVGARVGYCSPRREELQRPTQARCGRRAETVDRSPGSPAQNALTGSSTQKRWPAQNDECITAAMR